MTEQKYCLDFNFAFQSQTYLLCSPSTCRDLMMEKSGGVFSEVRCTQDIFLSSCGNDGRVKRARGRDRRAHKGTGLFSVLFASLHSHVPFPLHHDRVCKQANNNRAAKPGARRNTPPCAARGIALLVLPAYKTFVFLLTD